MHNSTPPTPPSGEQSDPTDMGNTEESQLRAPDCFEQWLHERLLERRDRQDDVAWHPGCYARTGRVAGHPRTAPQSFLSYPFFEFLTSLAFGMSR